MATHKKGGINGTLDA